MVVLVKFYSYCGMVGELEEMLIAESSTGVRETTLYTRVGMFSNYSTKRAKKRLLKRLRKRTGLEHNIMK